MANIITLDDGHFEIAAEKAGSLGTTPQAYIESLIDADRRTFDEILGPVREGFESMTDKELDDLFGRARAAARQAK